MASSGKTSKHLEIERKFDVAEATVSPSFDGLAAVTRVERSPQFTLDAVYYDTAERDLAARRITLRRRTGGSDAGWHLKLPAGADARTELRAPLGDDHVDFEAAHVPAELRDVVMAIVRDRPLAPVAQITTQRAVSNLYGHDDRKLAEFCDDRVSASATAEGSEPQQWREWELEFAEEHAGDGDGEIDYPLMDRLARRLTDAGAEPASRASKLARVLGTVPRRGGPGSDDPVHRAVAEEVANLVEWDRAVRADAYDSVHQMRVTTRKIRSLLQATESSFGLSDDSWILDELRQLAAILGVARDAEVLAERYEKALDGLPAELERGPVRQRLVDGARRRYRSAWRRSLAAMRTERYFRLLDALEELSAAAPPADAEAGGTGDATLKSAYRRVRKQAKRAETAEAEHRDESLHRIRKGAKRLRYTAAAVGAKKVADSAKTIQTLLGDHQDSVFSRIHLDQEAHAAHLAHEDTFTYGLLYQQEADLAQRSREQVESALESLGKAVRDAQ